MPSCVIRWCKNNSKVHNKAGGVTFHRLPTNFLVRDEWVKAIRLSRNNPKWQPSSSSIICSDHFDESDFYLTKLGLRKIHRTGYPKKKLFPTANSDRLSPDLSSSFVPIRTEYINLGTEEKVHTTADSPNSSSEDNDMELEILSNTSSVAIRDSSGSPSIVFDTSHALSPSTCSEAAHDLSVSPSVDVDTSCVVSSKPSTSSGVGFVTKCVVLPSTYSAADLKSFPTSATAVSDLLSPNKSSPFVPGSPNSPNEDNDIMFELLSDTSSVTNRELPDESNTNENESDSDLSVFDTLRTHKLRKKLKKRDVEFNKLRLKIKTLQQTVRRFKSRNLALKKIIQDLKTQNNINASLNNSLSGKTKQKKNITTISKKSKKSTKNINT